MNASANMGPQYLTAEQAGIVEDEFTPPGTRYKQDAYGQWVPAITPSRNHSGKQEHTTVSAQEFTPLDSSFHVVTPVLNRLSEIKGLLDKQGPRDPRTGEPTYQISGRSREVLEREYSNLLHHTLPHQMQRGAEADEWLAANPAPGSEADLRRQVAQRDAHKARVAEFVAEREAQAEAARIVAQRGR